MLLLLKDMVADKANDHPVLMIKSSLEFSATANTHADDHIFYAAALAFNQSVTDKARAS